MVSAWLLALSLGGMASTAFAVDAAQSLEELEHVVIQPRDGAPSNINDAVQVRDGFLWLATDSGLYQYDGAKFRRYRTPDGKDLPDADITSLVAMPSGGLWAATRFGHVYFITEGAIRSYGAAEGIPQRSICGMAADSDGHIWLGSASTGAFRLDGDRWINVPLTDGSPVTINGPSCIKGDGAGNVWTYCRTHASMLPRGEDRFHWLQRILVGPKGIVLDAEGRAWLGDNSGFFALSDSRLGISQAKLDALNGGRPLTTAIGHFDKSGMAWGLVDGRYFRVPASWVQMPAPTERSLQAVQMLPRADRQSATNPRTVTWLEDTESDLWIATRGGLDRFRSTKFRRAIVAGRALADVTIAVSPSGILWVGGSGGLFRREPGGEFVADSRPGDDRVCSACPLLATHDGKLFQGVEGALERLSDTGFEPQPVEFGTPRFSVRALTEDDAGRVWASAIGARGIFVGRDGHWTRRDGVDGVPSGEALSIASGGGRMWLGYPSNVLVVVDNSGARILGSSQGLDVGNVLAVLPQGEQAWIGGSNGLAYFDGQRMHPVANAQGVAMTGLSGMVITPEGDLWLNDDSGVQRISPTELATFKRDPTHRVDGEFFDLHSGIEGSPARIQPMPTTVRTPDGLLWFATSNGLYWIDPKNIPRNGVARQAYVTNVRANRVDHAAPPYDLPAGTSRLEIDFTAPLLATPDLVRFRYRLQGVDSDWQDATGRRQALYINVPPGSYQFEVMAANEDGAWSKTSTLLPVIIAAAYWQTAWFRAGCALSIAIIMWALATHWYRVRMHRLERSLRLEANLKQAERERIARDLHDTLLQSIYSLLWRIQAIALRLLPEDQNRLDLGEALDRAEKAVGEGRARVLNLHESVVESGSMVEQFRTLGEQWSSDTGTAFKLEVATPERHMRTAARTLIDRILSEALANAFRHSGASLVALRVRFDQDMLVGEVADDGTGIPREHLRGEVEGHLGLQIMRDRATMVGARLDIETSPGKGTIVRVTLSAKRAYQSLGLRYRVAKRLAWAG